MSKKNCFRDSDILPFDSDFLFNIIIDIESYPKFLRWCKSVEIIKKIEGNIDAETNILFKGIKTSYISHITYKKPNNLEKGFIEVRSYEGAFKYLYNLWEIIPQKDVNKTKISIDVEFEFSSMFLHLLFKNVYKKAQKEVINLFKQRIFDLSNKID